MLIYSTEKEKFQIDEYKDLTVMCLCMCVCFYSVLTELMRDHLRSAHGYEIRMFLHFDCYFFFIACNFEERRNEAESFARLMSFSDDE